MKAGWSLGAGHRRMFSIGSCGEGAKKERGKEKCVIQVKLRRVQPNKLNERFCPPLSTTLFTQCRKEDNNDKFQAKNSKYHQ